MTVRAGAVGTRGLRRAALLLPIAVGTAACQLTTQPFAPPAPGEVPRLESAVASDSTDLDAVTALVAGYVASDRSGDADALVAATRSRLPQDRTLQVLSALLEYELGDFAQATRGFRAYERASPDPLAAALRPRFDAIAGEALYQEALRNLAGPTADSVSAPTGRVAVLPLVDRTGDPDIGIGLAWLVSDLLSGDRFTAVTGREVDAVLRALEASASDRGQLATALRVARLTRADQAIFGIVENAGDGLVSWRIVVASRLPSGEIGITPIEGMGPRDDWWSAASEIGGLARNVVRGMRPRSAIVEALPAPAPQASIRSMARGFDRVFAGDWSAALAAFAGARAAAPDRYEMAEAWIARSEAARDALDRPLLELVTATARVGELRRAVAEVLAAPGSGDEQLLDGIGAAERAALAEALGLDRVGGGALVQVILDSGSGNR